MLFNVLFNQKFHLLVEFKWKKRDVFLKRNVQSNTKVSARS